MLFQQGDVMIEDLVLEVLGPRGDHHPLAAEDGGYQVGPGFSGAGACFRQQGDLPFRQ